jgi:predicted phosphodiesterase
VCPFHLAACLWGVGRRRAFQQETGHWAAARLARALHVAGGKGAAAASSAWSLSPPLPPWGGLKLLLRGGSPCPGKGTCTRCCRPSGRVEWAFHVRGGLCPILAEGPMRGRRIVAHVVVFLVACGYGAAPAYPASSSEPAQMAGSAPFLVRPYVNCVDGSSAKIVWVSGPGADAGRVVARGGGRTYHSAACERPIAGRDELLHVASVAGLRAGTRYDYTAVCGVRAETGSFRTAPTDGRVSFVVYGDSRTLTEDHAAVSYAIAAETADFVVHTGDLVTQGENWDEWGREFFAPARPYLQQAAVWPVRGNHEGDAVFLRELFELPGNELWYSFDYGNVHFAVLDSQVLDEDSGQMLGWLEQDLAGSEADWKFVALHVPMFNVGGHGSKWGRADFLPVVEQHGVDFVLAGHSHLHERFVPIGPAGAKPVIYVVTGGGGAPRHPASPSPLLAGGIGASELHYCLFEVDGERLSMTVRRPDGSVLDNLRLVKRNGRYQDEVMAEAVETTRAEALVFAYAELAPVLREAPRPGEPVTLGLDLARLPVGTTVEVTAGEGLVGWTVEPARGAAGDGELRTTARAPDNLRVVGTGLMPPLLVDVTVEADGRLHAVRGITAGASDAVLAEMIPAPKPLPVPAAPGRIRVDGDPHDWADVAPLPLPFHSEPAGPVRLCWNDAGLYGLAVVADESVTGNAEQPWTADSLELFVDKDLSRPSRPNEATSQYVFSPADGEGQGDAMIPYGADHPMASELRCSWRRTSSGYVLEFLIPAGLLLPARMEQGVEIGLNFCLNDDGRPIRQFHSDKSGDGWRMPLLWGVVELGE